MARPASEVVKAVTRCVETGRLLDRGRPKRAVRGFGSKFVHIIFCVKKQNCSELQLIVNAVTQSLDAGSAPRLRLASSPAGGAAAFSYDDSEEPDVPSETGQDPSAADGSHRSI